MNGQDATDDPRTVGNHGEEDVRALLARVTHDGKGDGDVPESDFVSFATEGVEKDED